MILRYSCDGIPQHHGNTIHTNMDIDRAEDDGTYIPCGQIISDVDQSLHTTTTIRVNGADLCYEEDYDLPIDAFMEPWHIAFRPEGSFDDSGIRLHKPAILDPHPLAQTYLEDRGIFYQVVVIHVKKNSIWELYLYDPDFTLEGSRLRYNLLGQMTVRAEPDPRYFIYCQLFRELPRQLEAAVLSLPFTLGLFPGTKVTFSSPEL